MRLLSYVSLALLLACSTETAPKTDDADADGVSASVDCDDGDASVYPGAAEVWYDGVDQDCDGNDTDQDGDGVAVGPDCDDTDPSVHPDAGEVPGDGIDQDCDGADATGTDGDLDGYASTVDCNDADPTVHPGAEEVWYDGNDQDCDGNDDDQDGDGYSLRVDCDDTDAAAHPGAGEVPDDGVDQDCDGVDSTSTVSDADGDGASADLDCDDGDPTVHPGAVEVWYDGVDQDCDGADDDQDHDGYARASDCDDTDATVFPGAGEVPVDGIDQDCDGADATYPSTGDADGDGYADFVDCAPSDASIHPGAAEVWYDGVDQDCDGADDDQDGDGYLRAADCDDTDATVFPGAGEVPVDGIDQDCDGADGTYPTSDDADGDGYGASVECDDANPSIHPGAVEVWYDGVDQDCDGVDDDQDGDGYVRASDCDDTDATAFPGADEAASDGVDQDCDGSDMYGAGDLGANALIVTEIMKKPQIAPESYGEWIELYNNSGHRLLLDGVTVTATSAGLSFTISGGVEVPAGGYAVLARDADPALNGGVTADFDYRSDLSLDNDAETLTLTYGSTTLDTVSYDDATFYPDSSGASMSLDSAHVSATSNDNGQYWCDGAASFGDGDLGTPGAANSACSGLTDADSDGYVSAHDCNDASRSIHPGASETARDGVDSDCDGADYAAIGMRSGELVVSEVMQNPDIVSDADGEWFEVYNSTTSTLNLYGLSVTDATGAGFTVDLDVIVASHGYVVFAVDADPLHNGGLPVVDYDYPGSLFALANSTDTINLYNGSTLIDGVTYDGLGTSSGGFPDPTGASMILSSRSFNATSNDRGTSWCTSTSYIADDPTHDLGTPGEANDGC